MSWVSKKEFRDRLRSATEQSPLAVFTIDLKGEARPGELDVVFANTCKARERIESGVGFVGVFHNRSVTWGKKLAEVLA